MGSSAFGGNGDGASTEQCSDLRENRSASWRWRESESRGPRGLVVEPEVVHPEVLLQPTEPKLSWSPRAGVMGLGLEQRVWPARSLVASQDPTSRLPHRTEN